MAAVFLLKPHWASRLNALPRWSYCRPEGRLRCISGGTMRLRVFAVLAVFTAACTAGQRAVVFPPAAELGDTVAMAVDSSFLDILDGMERHNLTRENVELEILNGGTVIRTLTAQDQELRNVFDGHASGTATSAATKPGLMLTAVLFDIPENLSVTPPVSLEVRLKGFSQHIVVGDLDIVGVDGVPLALEPTLSDPADLEPAPALRLRGLQDDNGVTGFDPTWNIGGIEFILAIPSWLDTPRGVGANEASGTVVTVGPIVSNEIRVVMLAPDGFLLGDLPGTGVNVGNGPFLDITFNNTTSVEFLSTDFSIRDLRIFDTNGVELRAALTLMEAETFFTKIVRANGS